MHDIERFCKVVEEEIGKIADKGLTTANLDTAYKLIDIYKDMKQADSYTAKKEYYEMETDMGGYSERRKRDRMGRYSRDDGIMMEDYEHGVSYDRMGRMPKHYDRDGGYSLASGHDEHYDKYMDSKHMYRSNKTPECKQRLMNTLEDYMDNFSKQMEEMLRDSDCTEERNTIKRYLDKIKNIS